MDFVVLDVGFRSFERCARRALVKSNLPALIGNLPNGHSCREPRKRSVGLHVSGLVSQNCQAVCYHVCLIVLRPHLVTRRLAKKLAKHIVPTIHLSATAQFTKFRMQ